MGLACFCMEPLPHAQIKNVIRKKQQCFGHTEDTSTFSRHLPPLLHVNVLIIRATASSAGQTVYDTHFFVLELLIVCDFESFL